MADFGSLSIALALAFVAYALFALFYGAKTGRRELVKSGTNAVYVVTFFVTCAVFARLGTSVTAVAPEPMTTMRLPA